jgi:tRNA threonylcarbamoyl adenosine modification protein YeaZ
MELIIDAASECATAGLASQGVLQWTSGPLAPRDHTRQLLPAILAGLQATSATFDDLLTIIVSLGPGPFNGLRVATSIAKGLAAGTGASVIGISTLEAEAYRCDSPTVTVRPMVCAGRTGFATALFSRQDGQWVQTEESRHLDASGLSDVVKGCECLCGDIAEVRKSLSDVTSLAALHSVTGCKSRLEVLAALGWRRFMAGQVTSAAALQPLYTRPPHITIARDRRP